MNACCHVLTVYFFQDNFPDSGATQDLQASFFGKRGAIAGGKRPIGRPRINVVDIRPNADVRPGDVSRVCPHSEGVQGAMPQTMRWRVIGRIRHLNGTRLAKEVWVMRDVVLLLEISTWWVETLRFLEERPAGVEAQCG